MSAASARTGPDPALSAFLIAHALARPGETARWTPLAGGVSSDLWRVDLPGRSLCVKRALAKLKVAADWQAPVSRNAYEWAWMRFAARHRPDSVPELLAHDPDAGLFAMAYLPPERHPMWKALLMAGDVRPETAAAVGELLGTLHAKSAGDVGLAAEFATDDNFHALRIEPYLLATAAAHPALSDILKSLADRTASTHLALIHGDVSPKNILVGPSGPVLLDAECAWYGDPAFDLAFCVNHLLLKSLVVHGRRTELLRSARVLTEEYTRRVDWEPLGALESRAASLLPALLLARVDGKSPVEYLTDDRHRDLVRTVATELLRAPAPTVSDVLGTWTTALGSRTAPVGARQDPPTDRTRSAEPTKERQMRRVVTGHDESGRSVVVSDGPVPRSREFTSLPGFVSRLPWATEPGAPVSPTGDDPTPEVTSLLPAPGGTRFIVLTLPPDSAMADPAFDPAAFGREQHADSPGLADLMEPDGMHTTPTVDYGIVLAGVAVLELDDGHCTPLSAGDIVIQNGTRHGWRNRGDGPVTLAFVLIGTEREG
ncbi:phosphotransferase [Streptomyces sp. NPDC001663]|uniref:phosphotransferase n=1 Tax=Streptomyces sp. NPDC001663 TaxID=3364597 RepID=UPI003699F407